MAMYKRFFVNKNSGYLSVYCKKALSQPLPDFAIQATFSKGEGVHLKNNA
jgi:hypothetical protein